MAINCVCLLLSLAYLAGREVLLAGAALLSSWSLLLILLERSSAITTTTTSFAFAFAAAAAALSALMWFFGFVLFLQFLLSHLLLTHLVDVLQLRFRVVVRHGEAFESEDMCQ